MMTIDHKGVIAMMTSSGKNVSLAASVIMKVYMIKALIRPVTQVSVRRLSTH